MGLNRNWFHPLTTLSHWKQRYDILKVFVNFFSRSSSSFCKYSYNVFTPVCWRISKLHIISMCIVRSRVYEHETARRTKNFLRAYVSSMILDYFRPSVSVHCRGNVANCSWTVHGMLSTFKQLLFIGGTDNIRMCQLFNKNMAQATLRRTVHCDREGTNVPYIRRSLIRNDSGLIQIERGKDRVRLLSICGPCV